MYILWNKKSFRASKKDYQDRLKKYNKTKKFPTKIKKFSQKRRSKRKFNMFSGLAVPGKTFKTISENIERQKEGRMLLGTPEKASTVPRDSPIWTERQEQRRARLAAEEKAAARHAPKQSAADQFNKWVPATSTSSAASDVHSLKKSTFGPRGGSHLSQDVPKGTTILPVEDTSPFRAGDDVSIGGRDAHRQSRHVRTSAAPRVRHDHAEDGSE